MRASASAVDKVELIAEKKAQPALCDKQLPRASTSTLVAVATILSKEDVQFARAAAASDGRAPRPVRLEGGTAEGYRARGLRPNRFQPAAAVWAMT